MFALSSRTFFIPRVFEPVYVCCCRVVVFVVLLRRGRDEIDERERRERKRWIEERERKRSTKPEPTCK